MPKKIVFDARINANFEITIPVATRDKYELHKGDIVEVKLLVSDNKV